LIEEQKNKSNARGSVLITVTPRYGGTTKYYLNSTVSTQWTNILDAKVLARLEKETTK
jgi:hypothetical protein|tara:strand:- start:151 stop:324 length:174 start_codon:yes stop_codon:yes gene_type:complete